MSQTFVKAQKPNPFTFILCSTEKRMVSHRRGRKEESFPTYDVFATIDGEQRLLGKIVRDMATFEKRTGHRTWVDRRWHAPRWFASAPGQYNTRRVHYDTRQWAAEALLGQYKLDHTP